MPTKVVYQGQLKTIEQLCTDPHGRGGEVADFLATLSAGEMAKLDTLFEYLGDRGRITNATKFKKLEGSNGIFEFKAHQIRLLGFWVRDRFVICRGLKKKQDRHRPADITFAERCKEEFIGE